MKMKIFMMLPAMLLTAAGMCAQTYKTAALYDLHGPVKSVRYDKEHPVTYLYGSVKFSKDGRATKDIMTYNPDGYPVGFGFKNDKGAFNVFIEYDAQGRPDHCSVNSRGDNNDETSVIEWKYDGDDVSALIIGDKANSASAEYLYSDLERDRNGNWVKRKVRMTRYKNGSATESEEYEESRDIEYYQAP